MLSFLLSTPHGELETRVETEILREELLLSTPHGELETGVISVFYTTDATFQLHTVN